MGWLLLTGGLAVMAVIVTAGLAYQKGRASVPNSTASYWQGFAEGEAFAQSVDRIPSPN